MKKWGIFLMMILSGCQTSTYSSEFLNRFYEIFDKETFYYSYLVVIPHSGCTGCITQAEQFFKENHGRLNVFFVFTKIYSKKDLGIRVGSNNLNRPNVYLDTDNRLYLSEFEENIYPVIFVFEEDNVQMEYLNETFTLPPKQ